MASIEPSPRTSALAFTEGVRAGWLCSDLIAWTQDHLITPGRLRVHGQPCFTRVHEGEVEIELDPKVQGRRNEQFQSLLCCARERVIVVLQQAVATSEPAFIHSALYCGRVSRERCANGRATWYVWLDEADTLSDHVLALFAADALTNPDDYEQKLAVCDACGAVTFVSPPTSRRGCQAHPFGAVSSTPARGMKAPARA